MGPSARTKNHRQKSGDSRSGITPVFEYLQISFFLTNLVENIETPMKIDTPFINIQTDFGFKRIFGTPENKEILIRFLNALLEGRLTVRDVVFHDKEILPPSREGKRIIYDVYCTAPLFPETSSFLTPLRAPEETTGERKRREVTEEDRTVDHHFIVEMQNLYTPPFEERMVYYSSKMISTQGRPGWNYELEPVVTVAVTDFNFRHMVPKLVRDVMLVDHETGEPLTDKVHIFFVSLKEVPLKWEDCRTELEHMMFLIKNMEDLNMDSLAYIEGRYAEIFEAARSSAFGENDTIAYSQSLEKLRETQAGFRYAADEALKKGEAIGMAKGEAIGIAKGEAIGLQKTAKEMLKRGIDMALISEITGLSFEEIRKIKTE